MNIKKKAASVFRSGLTLISPMLNTKVTYLVKFHKKLDLSNPITLNEKILWLKFNTYWNNPLIKQCADKYRVREYIERCGYPELLPELIGKYENVEEINWDKLPGRFALKLNVGCGYNIIVSDKKTLNIESTKSIMDKWLKSKYYLNHSEMQYKDVKPYILIEEYLGDDNGSLPQDYKFYCMNGKSKYVMVCADREIGRAAKYYYFDRDWKMMPYTYDALNNCGNSIQKPEHIDLAFDYAEKLSNSFPFVRVDMYVVKGKVYFGELTFTPSAGMDVSRMPSTDKILGEQLILPEK